MIDPNRTRNPNPTPTLTPIRSAGSAPGSEAVNNDDHLFDDPDEAPLLRLEQALSNELREIRL